MTEETVVNAILDHWNDRESRDVRDRQSHKGVIPTAAWFEHTQFTRVPALLFFNEAGHAMLRTGAWVLRQRMINSLSYVLERAYEKSWSYRRYARSKGIERIQRGQGAIED